MWTLVLITGWLVSCTTAAPLSASPLTEMASLTTTRSAAIAAEIDVSMRAVSNVWVRFIPSLNGKQPPYAIPRTAHEFLTPVGSS